jgi:hypothetical protein
MPPLFVFRAADGELVIYDGVTRATRAAKYSPGQAIPAEVIGTFKTPASHLPKVEDRLP